MYRIFIVEDDEGIAAGIANHFSMWDYECRTAANFRNITEEFNEYSPHLVLMDISLPFYDGYYWCGEIRKLSKVPVIFISSASDNMNIVMAVNMGADDFIAKPFDLSVLTAKVQAILRRSYDFVSKTDVIEHRGLILNTANGEISYKNTSVSLTKNEFKILLELMTEKGRTVSRDTLMEKLWKTENFIDENTLTVNVNRLRKKLEAMGLENFIETKFGQGYIIN